MKLPKELLDRKKNIRSQINTKELFSFVRLHYKDLLNLNSDKLTKIISRKVNDVSLKSKSESFFYNLLKEKFDHLNSEIGFKCKRCHNSCCKINDDSYTGIYKEDVILLQKNNIDDRGFIIPNNKLLLAEINKKGYSRILKIIKVSNQKQCYYFDSKQNKCRIYEFRPLVCYLFPFLIHNTRSELFASCDWILNKKEVNKEFEASLFTLKSHFEFMTATMLFLKKKNVLVFDKLNQKFWDQLKFVTKFT